MGMISREVGVQGLSCQSPSQRSMRRPASCSSFSSSSRGVNLILEAALNCHPPLSTR